MDSRIISSSTQLTTAGVKLVPLTTETSFVDRVLEDGPHKRIGAFFNYFMYNICSKSRGYMRYKEVIDCNKTLIEQRLEVVSHFETKCTNRKLDDDFLRRLDILLNILLQENSLLERINQILDFFVVEECSGSTNDISNSSRTSIKQIVDSMNSTTNREKLRELSAAVARVMGKVRRLHYETLRPILK